MTDVSRRTKGAERRLAVLAAASLLALGACSSTKDEPVATIVVASEAEPTTIRGVSEFTIAVPSHVETAVKYEQSPPAGGDHFPAWMNCGVYAEPVQNELAVHSLEHGAVWLSHRADADDTTRAALRSLAEGQTHVLVAPYPDMPSPIVATAWGAQLRVENAADPRLAAFVSKYQQGAQTPEPGAPCSGAVGNPT